MATSNKLLCSVVFVALSVAGAYTLHGIGFQNGLNKSLALAAEKRVMVGESTAWPDWLRGHPGFEQFVGALLGFFWPLVTGQLPAATLATLPFSGQVVAGWVITLVEGYRHGSKGTVASFTTTFGLLLQCTGYAVMNPLFLLWTLLSSRSNIISNSRASDKPFTDREAASLLVTDPRYLKVLPLSLISGYIVPTVIMCLPYPEVLSFDGKVIAVLSWQFFPLLTAASVRVWSFFVIASPIQSPRTPESTDVTTRNNISSQLPLFRKLYAFALVIATTTHIATLTISIASHITPMIFAAGTVDQFSLSTVFVPSLSTAKVSSVAVGALNLIKWDYIVGSTAHILWALIATAPVRKRCGKSWSAFSLGSVWVDVVVRSLVFGPLATMLTLIWERDEAVFGGEHYKVE